MKTSKPQNSTHKCISLPSFLLPCLWPRTASHHPAQHQFPTHIHLFYKKESNQKNPNKPPKIKHFPKNICSALPDCPLIPTHPLFMMQEFHGVPEEQSTIKHKTKVEREVINSFNIYISWRNNNFCCTKLEFRFCMGFPHFFTPHYKLPNMTNMLLTCHPFHLKENFFLRKEAIYTYTNIYVIHIHLILHANLNLRCRVL